MSLSIIFGSLAMNLCCVYHPVVFMLQEFHVDGEDEDLAPDLIDRLIPRREDFEENIDASIKQYKDILLKKVEVRGF